MMSNYQISYNKRLKHADLKRSPPEEYFADNRAQWIVIRATAASCNSKEVGKMIVLQSDPYRRRAWHLTGLFVTSHFSGIVEKVERDEEEISKFIACLITPQ